jgi:hypothetical protein
MMSKIVGSKMVRYSGSDETLVDVTCCEDAMEKWKALVDIHRAMQKINNYFNPRGYIQIINYGALPEMNFCPVCGNSYKEGA